MSKPLWCALICIGTASLALNLWLLLGLAWSSSPSASRAGCDISAQSDAPALAARVPAGARWLSEGESDPSSSGSSSGEGHHSSHPHDSLLFLFNAMIVGVVLLHLTAFPQLHNMQQTVALFVIGMAYSFIQEALKDEDTGVLGESYNMWMDIDPHLILFTMLPALIAGDAMTLDTSVVKRVYKRCLYLAGPGMFCNAMLAALFLMWYLPYDWSFELSLTTGAILAATDPVAVVNLLKQLGASVTMTVVIQGESLLNDGTAIVLYSLAYDMVKGESYSFSGVLVFIIRKAICACGLGWLIGWIFVVWINYASNRFWHHSSTIQMCLTLCCAYWSFFIAEGVLDMSGVLCTVSASLVLADNMWTSVLDAHSLEHVWHIVEFLGNTVIFFLAGSLTANVMTRIPFADYLHLLLIYVVLTLIRTLVTFASLPILRRLSADGPTGRETNAGVSLAEAVIMVWGGLRGAVGLALAIQVSVDKAGGALGEVDANRVLFYTGGVASLTLVVNATTCPALVKALGLVQTDETKRQMLLGMYHRMIELATDGVHNPAVAEIIQDMMKEIEGQFHSEPDPLDLVLPPAKTKPQPPSPEPSTTTGHHLGNGSHQLGTASHQLATPHPSPSSSFLGMPTGSMSLELQHKLNESVQTITDATTRVWKVFSVKQSSVSDGKTLLVDYDAARSKLDDIVPTAFSLLDVPHKTELDLSPDLRDKVKIGKPNENVMRYMNKAFLSLVRAEYWKQIRNGEFIKGSTHPETLLNSVAFASASTKLRLDDIDYLIKALSLDVEKDTYHEILRPHTPSSVRNTSRQVYALSAVIADASNKAHGDTFLRKLVKSTVFSAFIAFIILLNVVAIFVEEQEVNEDYTMWLIAEVSFNIIFSVEVLLKGAAFRRAYFKDMWNNFDLSLVTVGWAGIVIELSLEDSEDANVSKESRVLRINRIFRVLRLIRVFRLIKIFEVLRAKLSGLEISLELAKNMKAVTILTAFARAHSASEAQLVSYFGEASSRHGCELACCIVDSRRAICEAINAAACEAGPLEILVLERLQNLRESSAITSKLTHFILEAGAVGVVSATEAGHLLEPLVAHSERWYMEAKTRAMGIVDQPVLEQAEDRRRSRKSLASDGGELKRNPLKRTLSQGSAQSRQTTPVFNKPATPSIVASGALDSTSFSCAGRRSLASDSSDSCVSGNFVEPSLRAAADAALPDLPHMPVQ